MDIGELIDLVKEISLFVGKPVICAGGAVFVVGVAQIKVVVARNDKDWGYGAELLEPAKQAIALGANLDFVLAINKVASDANIIWLTFACGVNKSLESLIFDKSAKVDVAN